MEWKKVEDGLPPHGRFVLTTDGEVYAVGKMTTDVWYQWELVNDDLKKRVRHESERWSLLDAEYTAINVTHWMELPALPPKPPEDPEKKRERQLLGLEEKLAHPGGLEEELEHDDYLAENPK